jgi:hypothetical protein
LMRRHIYPFHGSDRKLSAVLPTPYLGRASGLTALFPRPAPAMLVPVPIFRCNPHKSASNNFMLVQFSARVCSGITSLRRRLGGPFFPNRATSQQEPSDQRGALPIRQHEENLGSAGLPTLPRGRAFLRTDSQTARQPDVQCAISRNGPYLMKSGARRERPNTRRSMSKTSIAASHPHPLSGRFLVVCRQSAPWHNEALRLRRRESVPSAGTGA